MTRKKALARLGYTEGWLSSGVMSEEQLLSQYEAIETSEDQASEHYRHSLFRDYLSTKRKMTNDEVAVVFALRDNHSIDLRTNRILELLRSNILHDDQLDWIRRYPEVSENPIHRALLRSKLLRKIDLSSIADSFEDIRASKDPLVHAHILERDDLLPEHVFWLAEFGGNRKLRNIAKQLALSKKFRGN